MRGTLARASRAAGALSSLIVRRRAAAGSVVLAYHDVGVESSAGNRLTVTVDLLRAHIRWLRRLDFEIVPLQDLVTAAGSNRSADRRAALTFDDGLLGVHRHALPVLIEERAPATVFVVTGAIGKEPRWWPGSGRTMTGAEMTELGEAGLTIASHTHTHRSLPGLPFDAVVSELVRSRELLAEWTHDPCDVLAYPYGHHDPAVRRLVQEHGYRAAFTYLNGRLTGVEDAFKLPRFTMGAHSTVGRLALQLGRPAERWPDHQADVVVDPNPSGP